MRKQKSDAALVDYLASRLHDKPQTVGDCEYDFYCPFCLDRLGSESNHRKLGINTKKGKAHCYRCGFAASSLGGLFRSLNDGRLRVIELQYMMRVHDTPTLPDLRNSVIEILYGTQETEKVEHLKCPPLPDHIQWLADEKPIGRLSRAFAYLKKRGITKEQIVKHDIAYCTAGKHVGHLIFPVVQGGELVYWTTRTVFSRTKQKSKNPKNKEGYYSKTTCLFNYDNVVGAKCVELSEGPLDALASPNAVACLGKEYSAIQLDLLVALVEYGTEEFVISLDAGTGHDSDRLYSRLVSRVPKLTQLTLTHGDPDSRKDELGQLLQTRRVPTVADRVRSRLKKG